MYISFYLCVGSKLAYSNIIQQIEVETKIHLNSLHTIIIYRSIMELLVRGCFKYWVIPNDNAKNEKLLSLHCVISYSTFMPTRASQESVEPVKVTHQDLAWV